MKILHRKFINLFLLPVSLIIPASNNNLFAGGYTGSAATQANTTGVNALETNREIIRVSVSAGTGAGSCGVSQMQFTMQNTNNADVANAKLFYTGTTSTFNPGSPGTQQGSTINNPTGTITFACSVSGLSNTTVYFWLTFDIAASPTTCNTLDALVPANGITITGTGSGTKTPTTPDPTGNRAVLGIGCWDYCTPTGNLTCTANDYISNVTINTLNNTTVCGTGGYTRYTGGGSETTSLSAGGLYTLSLSVGAGTGNHGAAVWIDFNNNGVFSDAGEYFLISNSISPSITVSTSIGIPTTAIATTTRMRVRYAYNLTVTSSMSCTMSGTYGETEDYTVTIASYPAHCSNTVLDGGLGETTVDCGGSDCGPYATVSMTPASPATVACGSGSYTLTASNVRGSSIQWQYSPDNSTWYDLGGATNLTYSGTAINSVSYFRAKITSGSCAVFYSTPSLQISVTGKASYYWRTSGATTTYTLNTNWWTTPSGPTNPPSAPSTSCDDVVIQASNAIPTITANTSCGDLTISSGTLILSGADLTVYGNFVNNGTLQDGIGYSTFLTGTGNTWSGAGIYTRSGGGDGGNIVIANGANYTLLNDVGPLYVPNVQSTLPSLVCYNTSGHLNIVNHTMIVSGVWCGTYNMHFGTGILDLRGGGSVDPGKTFYETGTLWINSSTNNFTFDLEDDYYNVWFSNSAGTTKFGGSAVNVSITNDNWIITGTLDNSQAGSNTIFIGGDWINDASYNAATATINLNGSTEQNIMGASSTTFNKLTINNTSSTGVIVQKECTVSTTLTLTDGILNTDQYSKYIYLPSTASVSPVGGSANSYVDGYIYRVGSTAFVFPTGDGNKWARIEISASGVATQQYNAKYIQSGYGSYTYVAPLTDVSAYEYWILNQVSGTNDVQVTLYWEDASWSHIDDCDLPAPDDLRVAHHNGTNWEINVDGSNYTGTCGTSGSVQTNAVQPTYSPFTFGSKSALVNPLPVTLLRFDAVYNGTYVDLTWVTESETNNDYFTVERSKDATDFTTVTTVDGAGNSNEELTYYAVDRNPLPDVSYYRLKQTDFDGRFTYSGIVAVTVARTYDFSIQPNPAKNTLNIALSCACENEVTVEITNITGKPVQREKRTAKKGDNILPLDVRMLPQGLYFIKVSSGEDIYMEKFIKE